MNDIKDWQRYYGEERVKRAELEVATDELVEAAEMVLACVDQPRSRDNSEHAGIDAVEALRKATAEVKEFNSATLKYVHGLSAGDLPMVGDLAMLVARLARKLRKAAPADELPAQALDYLNRNGLKGSPLREVGAGGTALEVHGTVFFKDNHQYRSQLRFPVADGAYELVKIESPDMTHPLFHVAGESFEVIPEPLQKLGARLAELLDEDQFAECEALLLAAGVKPYNAELRGRPLADGPA